MQLARCHRLRFSMQFLIASFPVAGPCTRLRGSWIGAEMKLRIAKRRGGEAAVYVEV